MKLYKLTVRDENKKVIQVHVAFGLDVAMGIIAVEVENGRTITVSELK